MFPVHYKEEKMKEIRLMKLTLNNFKGIKHFELVTDGTNINVGGANATGKTTLFDAFIWVLFGKDSHYKSDFGIKTYTTNGEVLHGLDHSVEVQLEVNGKSLTLEKVYRESWTKKKGEAERILTGNETEHFINEVPVKKSEYTAYISELVDEEIFKLITNVMYFNSSQMHWTKRRELVLGITSDIDDADVIESNKELYPLRSILEQRSLDDHKKIIAGQLKKYNNELKNIPIRIDEINRNLPALPENVDFGKLEEDKLLHERKIQEFDERINSQEEISKQFKDKSRSLSILKSQLFDMKMKLTTEQMKKQNSLEKELNEALHQKELLVSNIKRDEVRASDFDAEIKKLDEDIKDLRNDWDIEFRKEFDRPDRNDFKCPTCHQQLPEGDVDSQISGMLANFKHHKKRMLDEIQSKGKFRKDRKAKLEKELSDVISRLESNKEDLEKLMATINRLDTELSAEKQMSDGFCPESDELYVALKEKVSWLEIELEKLDSGSAVHKLIEDKKTFAVSLNDINKILNSKHIIRDAQRRIDELMEEERRYSDLILKLQKEEFLIGQFIISKVNLLEESINKKFRFVKFKLFNRLVNGGIEECFETTVDGVPYSDLNTAASINAGIDIINVLCEHFNVRAPIFIDNNESINTLMASDSQVIGLFVTEDPQLRVIGMKIKKVS